MKIIFHTTVYSSKFQNLRFRLQRKQSIRKNKNVNLIQKTTNVCIFVSILNIINLNKILIIERKPIGLAYLKL